MARREVRLTPCSQECIGCGKRLWVAYHAQRTLMTCARIGSPETGGAALPQPGM